jgi:hypothetical protein
MTNNFKFSANFFKSPSDKKKNNNKKKQKRQQKKKTTTLFKYNGIDVDLSKKGEKMFVRHNVL